MTTIRDDDGNAIATIETRIIDGRAHDIVTPIEPRKASKTRGKLPTQASDTQNANLAGF